MTVFASMQKMLARESSDSQKVAVLFLIFTAAFYVLAVAGVDDLASPTLAVALVPVALLYMTERLGKVTWFTGMTLPSLLVMAGMIAFLWVLNVRAPVPAVLVYCVLTGWIITMGFLAFRVWTFDHPARPVE
ncbi:hypothetical protein RZN05_05550 [Sphingomonas sp. HF-S4]|uniref:Uncharacterized protein n=1 Tax=Sphingomonas agrestis TaxID=3080540 RepID=A0ABU3Y536_9SPHN|nr:hypothetical protein [Sphingomonas sp. HF-S4]MDV3456440.1 hypothetical protein [Sphingomonas sp. HF-S4]